MGLHVHLDLVGGLAGDMFLAAALDAGLIEKEALERALSGLGFGRIEAVVEKTRRGALAGTHLAFRGWDPAAETAHRHLSTILEILEGSELATAVRARAAELFRILGEAEAAVHGIPLERVHFHECGAVDSILDFVGAAWMIETLGATWSAGPVPMGRGTVRTDHGLIPVPVPATARLLEGFEMEPRPVDSELVTPTGAALLRGLRETTPGFGPRGGRNRAVGYGLGSRELGALSNAVRFLVLESEEGAPAAEERISRLACDLDDMNPELVALLEARLLAAGALDVVRQAVWMKKGRQGTRLELLCRSEDRAGLAELLFRESTTFGLRVEEVRRLVLAREMAEVETPWGPVRVKLGSLRGEVIRASPELEDCARLAAAAGVPASRVFAAASAAARQAGREG